MRLSTKPFLYAALIAAFLAGCGEDSHDHSAGSDHGHGSAGDHDDDHAEAGPNNGKLLEDGDFSVEVTIYETGQDPIFRVYPALAGKALDPKLVQAQISLKRLDGETNQYALQPESTYLTSKAIVAEPHSFDVTVTASYQGKQSRWTYPSYEGRTAIDQASADEAGVTTEVSGPATLTTSVDLVGRVDFIPTAKASIKARYPGTVKKAIKTVGDVVRKGDVLAVVESSQSLQNYNVIAPFNGVILERWTNQGDVAGDAALYVIGDLGNVEVNLHVFPGDVMRIRKGQKVTVRSLDGHFSADTVVSSFLPTAEAATQTLVARAALPNNDRQWLPGMTVQGAVVVTENEVPLAVRTSALQRINDKNVVFIRIGTTYEARILELGKRSKDWIEVLSGLNPGQHYVTQNSFLIKADIEKSGASHDH